jgi:hypothetical protein
VNVRRWDDFLKVQNNRPIVKFKIEIPNEFSYINSDKKPFPYSSFFFLFLDEIV